MFWHYLHSALLAVKAQGKYTVINILGLAVGLCATLILLLIIVSETGFDTYHPQHQRLARLEIVFDSMDNTQVAAIAGPMGPLLVEKGLVADSTRLTRRTLNLRVGKRQYLEPNVVFADTNLADMLHFDTLAGDIHQALTRPEGLVITQSTAKRWFGAQQPLNQRVMMPTGEPMQVLAVIADLPRNTHLQLDMIAGMASLEAIEGRGGLESWMRNDFYTYVRLADHVQRQQLEQRITALLSQPIQQIVPDFTLHFVLQPISDIHLHGHAMNEFKVNGDARQMSIFASLIAVILFIAIFNYINFATATAGRRAKEIGVRQVVGATRSMMVNQFMCESLLLVFIAFAVALIGMLLLLPWVNAAFDQSLQFSMLWDLRWFIWMFGLFMLVVLGAGFYPALVLSAIPTLAALRGAGFKGKSGHWFRRSVLFCQLACAIGLAILGGHIYAQIRLIEQTPLGYEQQNKLVFSDIDSRELFATLPMFAQQLQRSSNIKQVAAAEFIPSQQHGNVVSLRSATQHQLSVENVLIDTVSSDFFATMGIKLLAGREFLPQEHELSANASSNESIPVIINKTVLVALGYTTAKEAIGQQLTLGWDPSFDTVNLGRIIAVVDNYYTTSLKAPLRPMVFVTGNALQAKSQLVVSFDAGHYLDTLAQLRTLWASRFSSNFPRYQLLSSRVSALYRQDRLGSNMVNLFNLLALLVVTFGVLGLCSFSAQRRLKEFALRQLMGAGVLDLCWILGREFLVLVLVAWSAIILPTWWLTEHWLVQFMVHVGAQWWLYLLAPLLLMGMIALVVVGVVKLLGHVNLARVLRTE
ncbi:ABC transporter permease [Shewanella sp. A3A]|nr:ABC transporter permease [Shewanella ferrihydritica]